MKLFGRTIALGLALAFVLAFAAGAGAIQLGFGIDAPGQTAPPAPPAAITGVIHNVSNAVNFRSEPKTSASRVSGCSQIKKGQPVTVLATVSGWYQVQYGTFTGYVSADYVKITSAGGSGGSGAAYTKYDTPKTGVSKDSVINIRSTPATGSSNVITAVRSARGKTFSILGESGTWYYASYNGTEGFVRQQDFTISGGSTGGGTGGGTAPAYTKYDTPKTGVSKDSVINIRSTPATGSSNVITAVKSAKGKTFTLLGESGTWYYASYNGTEGFVRQQDFTISGGSTGGTGGGTTPAYTKYDTPKTGVSKDSVINIRSTPATGGNVITAVKSAKGKTFTLLGESGTWYYASYNGTEGFVRQQDFTISSGSTGGGTPTTPPAPGASYQKGKLTFAQAVGSASNPNSADVWGQFVDIPGTNIGTRYNKLHDNNIYCNGLDSKSQFVYNPYNGTKNYFYAVSYLGAEISVIMGHNMRSSLTGMHYLHHVQNAWLGISKCEKCGKAVGSAAKSNVFKINYEGKSQWELLCFYEVDSSNTSAAQRKEYKNYNGLMSYLTGDQKVAWAQEQFRRANTKGYKGMVLNSSVSAHDQLMILITCADKTGQTDHSLYFVLKAIG